MKALVVMVVFLLCINVNKIGAKPSIFTIQSNAHQEKKMPLMIGLIGDQDKDLATFANYVKLMLDRKNQKTSGFEVTVKSFDKVPGKNAIKKIFQQGYPLAVFVNRSDVGFEWRMYDTRYASMVSGKKFSQVNVPLKVRAEYLSDQLWPILTGQEGYFSSRIAYCKEIREPGKKTQKHICLVPPYADPSSEYYPLFSESLVSKGRTFAPRWNKDLTHPLILYSEGTPSNVRLMSISLNKQRKLVSNFEGLNILPSYSADGNKVVYCLSRNGKSQLYLYELDSVTHEPVLKQITQNNGNNFSPVLRDNGDIVFCSDFQGKSPQICYYHAFTQQVEVLTKDGYCTSPSICEKMSKIAYSKFIDGAMQIFLYDLKEKTHQQVTFDVGNKEECTWSPCGNYVAYVVDTGGASRIAVMNLLTDERSYITPASERCSYPSWSPKCNVPLIVV
jgi:tol-pal system beta propeller repeat protein TolB